LEDFMKKFSILLALLPMSAFAVTTYDTARVESVTPQVEQIRVPGVCRNVTVREQQAVPASDGVGGSIVGGVVGGLLGSKIGGGNGRTVAAAAGAITGAIVGGNMDRSGPTVQEVRHTREICEPDTWSTRTTGYLVNYEYKGERGSFMSAVDPGRTVEMRVSAEPVAR
jgi:uncharacterized protein YcfJ